MVSADPSFVQPRILLGLAYLGKYNTGEAIKQFVRVNAEWILNRCATWQLGPLRTRA